MSERGSSILPSGDRPVLAYSLPPAAIVTGGGTGIGAALTTVLAKSGVDVLIVGRRPEPLQATADCLTHAPGSVYTMPCDIRDPDSGSNIAAFASDVMPTFPTALVNNAGGQFPVAALDVSPRGWNAVVDVNLSGTFHVSRGLAKTWITKGIAGVIANMTIPWHSRGAAGLTPAVAARSGVVGLTKSLCVEWAPYDIRVNCISPGLVLTDGMVDEEFGGNRENAAKLVENIPLGRATDPQEVAMTLAFMISDSASYLNGAIIAFDGGAQHGPGVNFLDPTLLRN